MSDIDKILSDKMGAENGFEAYIALKATLRAQLETAKDGGVGYFEASSVYATMITGAMIVALPQRLADAYEMLAQFVCAEVYGVLSEFEDDCSV